MRKILLTTHPENVHNGAVVDKSKVQKVVLNIAENDNDLKVGDTFEDNIIVHTLIL